MRELEKNNDRAWSRRAKALDALWGAVVDDPARFAKIVGTPSVEMMTDDALARRVARKAQIVPDAPLARCQIVVGSTELDRTYCEKSALLAGIVAREGLDPNRAEHARKTRSGGATATFVRPLETSRRTADYQKAWSS